MKSGGSRSLADAVKDGLETFAFDAVREVPGVWFHIELGSSRHYRLRGLLVFHPESDTSKERELAVVTVNVPSHSPDPVVFDLADEARTILAFAEHRIDSRLEAGAKDAQVVNQLAIFLELHRRLVVETLSR
jgi:hypothetical protein